MDEPRTTFLPHPPWRDPVGHADDPETSPAHQSVEQKVEAEAVELVEDVVADVKGKKL